MSAVAKDKERKAATLKKKNFQSSPEETQTEKIQGHREPQTKIVWGTNTYAKHLKPILAEGGKKKIGKEKKKKSWKKAYAPHVRRKLSGRCTHRKQDKGKR